MGARTSLTPARCRLVAAVLAAGTLVVLLALTYLGRGRGPTWPVPPLPTSRALSCRPCHAEVYEEWKSSSHAIAFVDPPVVEASQDFRNRDCIPCHAPRPVFESGAGVGTRVLARDAGREDGVDCLACHGVTGGVAAARAGLTAPCNPIETPLLLEIDVCAPCHDQHGTVSKEWFLSEHAALGLGCSDCHMPAVARKSAEGGSERPGRSHRFPGAHDVEFLKTAIDVSYELETQVGTNTLTVSVTNRGAGHHVPTDSRDRALDLVVRLFDETGEIVSPEGLDGLREGSAGNLADHRLRFRNPYRTEFGLDDTRIAAGARGTLKVPLTESVSSAEIRVIYKLTPDLPDEAGYLLYESRVELR
ncbi:MAG: multiheme c-type cytochrome [Planctomycetota bacterium]